MFVPQPPEEAAPALQCRERCWLPELGTCPCSHMVTLSTPSKHLVVLNISIKREQQYMFQSWKPRTQSSTQLLSLSCKQFAQTGVGFGGFCCCWFFFLFVQSRENGLGLKKYSESRYPWVSLKAESRARSVGNESHLLAELSQILEINT